MAETIEKSLLDLDFASLTRRTFAPSPAAWEDQVLYVRFRPPGVRSSTSGVGAGQSRQMGVSQEPGLAQSLTSQF